MSVKIRTIQSVDTIAWDAYVHAHPDATLYHLSGWKNIIEKTYGHKTYYLIATKNTQKPASSIQHPVPSTQEAVPSNQQPVPSTQYPVTRNKLSAISHELNIVGILPLVHLKHFLFGNSLISIPFFDLGGILADNEETEKALLSKAIALGQKLNVNNIELRHIQPLSWFDKANPTNPNNPNNPITVVTKSHKARMLLKLPESSEILMKSFKSKLRSQIKKPVKEGLKAKIGSLELIEDFYKVFLINMRDLGSPVHSKKLVQNVLEEFPEKAKIVMIYKAGQPVACSIIVGFKETLENPWASALKQYSRLSPNMLLYWSMLEYACDNGYKYFDFGRSTPDEGTYKFKAQWGAKPNPLYWHYLSLNGTTIDQETSEKSKFDKAIHYWQKLPVPVTKILGPMIRKHIGL